MSPRGLVALALVGFFVSMALTLSRGEAEPSPPAPPLGALGELGSVSALQPQSALAGRRFVPTGRHGVPSGRRGVPSGRRGVAAYRGAGAWVDQYDADVLDDPFPALSEMKARGVRTVYLETGSWRLPPALDFRDQQGAELVIDQAHGLGMKVVAWYLPGLDDVPLDMRRTRAALRLVTSRGGRFDGFAADIESQRVGSIALRNAALLRYSRGLRRAAGPGYALGAIVPDERSATLAPGLWPGLPYAALAPLYDVFLPMAYSSYRGHGASFAYAYTRTNVEFLRAVTRRPVHLIGGIDPNLLPSEPRAIVRGALDGGAIGASFYDFAGAQDATWRALRGL